MKHFYYNEQISRLEESLWKDYPLNSFQRPAIRYCERTISYKQANANAIFTQHNHYELVFVFDGEVELQTQDGGRFFLNENSIILIPPHTLHRELIHSHFDMMWLGFNIDFAPKHSCALKVITSEEISQLSLRLWKLLITYSDRIGLELEGLLLLIIGVFCRLNRLDYDQNLNIQNLIEHLQLDPIKYVSIDEMAEMCKMSKSHLFREFRRVTNMTPIAFQLALKLNIAKKYLKESNLPANQIAKLCGFSDHFYFSKIFKNNFGISPIKFRLQDSE